MGQVHNIHAPGIGADGQVVVHGNWGRPMLWFPAENGNAGEFEREGMRGAIGHLLDAGRVKVYSVDSFDAASWSNDSLPLEERARRHGAFEDWIVNHVAPFIHADCGGFQEIVLAGCSLGAFHAANTALRRADLFPVAICLSGVYDLSPVGWGEQGEAFYFNNPQSYVANLHGDHLNWLRRQLTLVLVCGQGQWEDSTGALDSTRRFGDLLTGKGLRHDTDIWGWDVAHDWPWWQKQLPHHLARFC
jgi:esterase/lipase superfamily enzyme